MWLSRVEDVTVPAWVVLNSIRFGLSQSRSNAYREALDLILTHWWALAKWREEIETELAAAIICAPDGTERLRETQQVFIWVQAQ